MSTHNVGQVKLTLHQGNIVEVEAGAIVNAANAALAGGGGVDGAIHRAAGPSVMAECRKIGGCPTGSAVATGAGQLKACYIFHAVGPRYRGREEDAHLLTSAYQACLALAEQHALKSIAFPAISAGIYGYPLKEAAEIALRTVIEHVKQPTSLQEIIFVLFDSRSYEVYEQVIAARLPSA